jgi:hypothetical protein
MKVRLFIGIALLFIMILAPLSSSVMASNSTQTPTRTPTLTRTRTPTRTPTVTVTPNLTGTQQAENRTATAEMIGLTRTQQAENRTATAEMIGLTRTQQADDRTATADSRAATATFKAQYQQINYRELANYADRHVGDLVKIQGRVFNIIDNTTIQIWLEGSFEAAVISSIEPVYAYENDWVTVYGTVKGFFNGTNSYGADIKQPLIVQAVIVGPKH